MREIGGRDTCFLNVLFSQGVLNVFALTLFHSLSLNPTPDSMEKSKYGPPQDVSAPPYPGFPAGYQGSGGGTAYPPQPGFQGGKISGLHGYSSGQLKPTLIENKVLSRT